MLTDEIRKELFALADEKYRDFQAKLIPAVKKESIIGVRTPLLKALARDAAKRDGVDAFLTDLPHRYFEENQLHAFIISGIKDFDACVKAVDAFLPFVDNWATCDQLSPKVFRRHKEELLRSIKIWIESGETYTVRFGAGMLMAHYLDADFDPAYPKMIAAIESDEYYVNMMRAWYFATALAKQYDAVLPYFTENRLDRWTHNKAIQKARESFRVPDGHKAYLKTLAR